MAEIKKSVLGSVRLDSDVWAAVRAMDCSLNQYLRAVLLEKESEYAPSIPTVPHVERLQVPPKIYSDPREIPGVSIGLPPYSERQYPCVCNHTGCQGGDGKFLSDRRGATLCPNCFRMGHRMDARNCQECFNDTGPA